MAEISVREFSRRIGVSDVAVGKAIKAGYISRGVIKDAKGRPRILFEVAKDEWNNRPGASKKSIVKEEATNSRPEVSVPVKNNAPSTNTLIEDAQEIPYKESLRREKFFAAKKKELEVAELQKILVNREQVYKELFAAGAEVRAALQMIPDKYIDNIMASSNRNEAHSILYEAITEALEALSFKNVNV